MKHREALQEVEHLRKGLAQPSIGVHRRQALNKVLDNTEKYLRVDPEKEVNLSNFILSLLIKAPVEETKIIERYDWDGLGFPVELHNVQLIKIRDDWHPKVDTEAVALTVFHSLIRKNPWSGREMKFIHEYMGDSIYKYYSHDTVRSWEDCGEHLIDMDSALITKVKRMMTIHETGGMDRDHCGESGAL